MASASGVSQGQAATYSGQFVTLNFILADAMAAGGVMFERHQGHRSGIEVADRLHHDR
ncbi:hypothetical protein ABIA24_004463 [Sinorhizobium fredii]|uniref:Uncharacterized protein n=1 Tax=Sinorhizobium fredii (strain HH103) TaxID=1117943 RepID=G9A2N6_SINF1|nr:hypothetical protein AB395_00006785 [Sinorhizobium fredii CCBAU 45436]CCE97801.1 hypothetical protein SFHH103_03309 [Sinorhizobium fredii HH103]